MEQYQYLDLPGILETDREDTQAKSSSDSSCDDRPIKQFSACFGGVQNFEEDDQDQQDYLNQFQHKSPNRSKRKAYKRSSSPKFSQSENIANLDLRIADFARSSQLQPSGRRMSGLQVERQTLGGLENITVMNLEIERLKKQNSVFYIRIENQTFEFNFRPDDVIFQLSTKNTSTTASVNSKCSCCTKPYQKAKDTRLCDFCSLTYCQSCRPLKKQYPQSSSEEEGNICKVCTRKFHLRELLQDGQLQIEAQTIQLLGEQGMQKQIQRAEDKIQGIQENGKKIKKQLQYDLKKMQSLVDRLTNKKNNIINQQETLKDQSTEYVNVQSVRTDTILKIKSDIQKTRIQESRVFEDMDKVNNHIILNQTEERKLQQEWHIQVEQQRIEQEQAKIKQIQKQRREQLEIQMLMDEQNKTKNNKKDKKKKKTISKQEYFSPRNGSADRDQVNSLVVPSDNYRSDLIIAEQDPNYIQYRNSEGLITSPNSNKPSVQTKFDFEVEISDNYEKQQQYMDDFEQKAAIYTEPMDTLGSKRNSKRTTKKFRKHINKSQGPGTCTTEVCGGQKCQIF